MLIFLDPTRFAALRSRVNADPEFRLVARAVDYRIQLSTETSSATIRIDSGEVVSIKLDPFLEPHDFGLMGFVGAWEKLLIRKPPPHYHHVYAAMFRRTLTISGNLEAAFSSLAAVSRLIDLMRLETTAGDTSHG